MLNIRLKKLREDKGLPQNQLAENLGISRNSVYNYEVGTRKPDVDILQKYSEYFNVSTDYLLGKSKFKNFDDEYDFRRRSGNAQLFEHFNKNERDLIFAINVNFSEIINSLKKNRDDKYFPHALVALNQLLCMITYVKTTLVESFCDMEEYIEVLKALRNPDVPLAYDSYKNIEIYQGQLNLCRRYLNQFLNLYVRTIYDIDNMKLRGGE